MIHPPPYYTCITNGKPLHSVVTVKKNKTCQTNIVDKNKTQPSQIRMIIFCVIEPILLDIPGIRPMFGSVCHSEANLALCEAAISFSEVMRTSCRGLGGVVYSTSKGFPVRFFYHKTVIQD